ncbi:hypothetical protein [Maribacter sp. 2-571]|uniref:hypothetical protein n=1 Tax=Maribacter sp. 2-571 TaxID=3417569 RepID=UPI003D334D5B
MTVAPKGKRPEQTVYQKRKRKKESSERNAIEGEFGQAKQAYCRVNHQMLDKDVLVLFLHPPM